MQIASISSFTVVVTIVCRATLVASGWPSGMGEKDKTILESIISGKQAIPEEMRLFVKYKDSKGKRVARRWSKNRVIEKHLPKQRVLVIRPKSSQALKKLLKNPNIEYVEPIHEIRALSLREGKGNVKQFHHTRRVAESIPYGIDMVQASPSLWGERPKSNMTICILDSGYGLGHPDLPNKQVNGSSSRTGDWRKDEYGHGSHCAGVIGAIGVNNVGVIGVMSDPTRFRFHIGKVLDSSGYGSEEDLIDAFESCIDAGANVISMSLGTDDYSETVRDACKEAYDDGILIVSAAGNAGHTEYSYPASYPYVMSVAAVDKAMKVAEFSQYNDQVEIAGPGVDIHSTVTTNNGRDFGYESWSGTSMATPFVAGVAALVWGYFPECTNNQLRNVLIRTAKSEGGPGCNHELGYGVVQAKGAYELLKKEGCVAGDEMNLPLSVDGIGGCFQDPQYTASPTQAPTAFNCADKAFLLELITDEWAEETSWDLRNSENVVVGSGGGYRKATVNVERLCLPNSQYTFTLRDSGADGICCQYGEGSYAVYFEGNLVSKGAVFKDAETVLFGEEKNKKKEKQTENSDDLPTEPQPPTGKSETCQDDKNWVFKNSKGIEKRCKYLQTNSSIRCKLLGVDEFGQPSRGYESCPLTCGACDVKTSSPTSAPSPFPTASPTSPPSLFSTLPSSHPTIKPSAQPTGMPSPKPNELPSFQPSVSPTPWPSPFYENAENESPRSHPSVSPTKRPTIFPLPNANYGENTPSSRPTIATTIQPTRLSPLKLTEIPSFLPSDSPTMQPAISSDPKYMSASACIDNPDWRDYGQGKQTCDDLEHDIRNKRYSECSKTGLANKASEHAFKHCPFTCGICEFGETLKDECQDDAFWHHDGTKDKSCAWVADSPDRKCGMKGINANGKTTFAYQSCRKTCDTCFSGVCRDNPDWKMMIPSPRSNEHKARTCFDIYRELFFRCDVEGNANGVTTTAFHSCPLSCKTCKPDTTEATKCIDDEQWRHVDPYGGTNFCRTIAPDVVKKCKLNGLDGNGNISSGYQACQRTCGSCPGLKASWTSVANEGEAPQVTAPEHSDDYDCQDNPSWIEGRRGGRKCSDFANDIKKRIYSKCIEFGDLNGRAERGFVACPLTCNVCTVGEIIPPTECQDDKEWRLLGRDTKKFSCTWVASKPEDKCKAEGIDRNGKRTWAYESCRNTCGTCVLSGMCQDNPKWRNQDATRCSELIDFQDKYSHCDNLGIFDGKTTAAYQSCPRLCNMCRSPNATSKGCEDDEGWQLISTNDEKLTCEWVGEYRKKNCKEVGIGSDGQMATGYQACRKTCGSCL